MTQPIVQKDFIVTILDAFLIQSCPCLVDTVINILHVQGVLNATRINVCPPGANMILIVFKDFIVMVVQFASDWRGQAPS